MPDKNHTKGLAGILLQTFQAFSMDVVMGALASGYFAVKLLYVSVNPYWWLVLALSVWAVYTGDHLLDGFFQKQAATMFRHRMHYRHRYLFIVALLSAAFTSVVLVWIFMDRFILFGGIVMGVAALVYLTFIYFGRKKNFYFHKELFISIFYVSGVWLAPVVWYGKPLSIPAITSMFIYFLLAWAEGLMMAYYEQVNDRGDRSQSFCTFYGVSVTRNLTGILLMSGMLLSLTMVFFAPALKKEFFLLIIMSSSLMLLLFFPVFFQKNERYRLLGEMTFWLPLLLAI